MHQAHYRARFDWMVELAGAAAAGLAAGFAAFKLAPSFGLVPAAAMAGPALAAFGLGLLAMKTVKPAVREHAFAGFSVAPIVAGEPSRSAEEPLLLEVRYVGSTPIDVVAEKVELLLDDPLVKQANSRVVQLFAGSAPPTAGELNDRIDGRLATGAIHSMPQLKQPAPDASEALYAALAELRRSLS